MESLIDGTVCLDGAERALARRTWLLLCLSLILMSRMRQTRDTTTKKARKMPMSKYSVGCCGKKERQEKNKDICQIIRTYRHKEMPFAPGTFAFSFFSRWQLRMFDHSFDSCSSNRALTDVTHFGASLCKWRGKEMELCTPFRGVFYNKYTIDYSCRSINPTAESFSLLCL